MLTRLESTQRGRPSRFNRITALTKVTELFWQNGFDGTSLDDICRAVGVHRPTLYRFLGSKEDVYTAALEGYLSSMQARIDALLQKPGSIEAILLNMFRGEFAQFAKKGRGCFVIVTAIPIAPRFERVDLLLRSYAARRQASLMRRLNAAAQSNELRQKIELSGRALLALTVLDGLGSLSRLEPRENEVLPAIKWAVSAICRGGYGHAQQGKMNQAVLRC